MTIFPFSHPSCALKVDFPVAIITLENIMPTPKAYSTKGSRKMYLSGDSQHFENAVSNLIRVEAMRQGIEQLPKANGYRLFFMFLFHGDPAKPMLKKPDVTNLIKGAEDALVKSGLIADDANVIEIRAEKKMWDGTPGLTIGIDYGTTREHVRQKPETKLETAQRYFQPTSEGYLRLSKGEPTKEEVESAFWLLGNLEDLGG